MKVLAFVVVYLAIVEAKVQDMGDGVTPDFKFEQERELKIEANNRELHVGYSGTVLNKNQHYLGGSAYVAKHWVSHRIQPDQFGGRIEYTNKPLASTAFLEADHNRHLGTDVNTGVKYNFVNEKNIKVDVTGQYGRHFGGPQGNGKPEAGVFLHLIKTF